MSTGTLHPHRCEDFITKLAPVDYDPDAQCPLWEMFCQKITAGNEGIQSFLQRAVGYALTGDTSEQVLFILYGTGMNGKSTFLETIRAIAGDHARHTPTETLMVKRYGGIPNDLARLCGARLVTAIETEDGKRLAESLIKQLTGGDPVTARFLNREFFDFHPMFKLFLAANHKPQIRGTDHAIWRRLRLIPFTVEISKEEQDKKLPQKLRKELSGILRWAVAGCTAWQRHGLGEPASVQKATDDYRHEMDMLGQFLSAVCVIPFFS